MRIFIKKNFTIDSFRYLIRWIGLSILVATFSGSASAIFLISLDYISLLHQRQSLWLYTLPISGFSIGLLYHYWGGESIRGNKLLIEAIDRPVLRIPFRMIPLVLLTTLMTHLSGGSAGREGTAVQMGGSGADAIFRKLGLKIKDRPVMIIMGIGAGFASVFGTPLAGAVFALEVIYRGKIWYRALVPAFLTAILAHQICMLWPVQHIHYSAGWIPEFNFYTILYACLSGIIFGFCAYIFTFAIHWHTKVFARWIHWPPLRPFMGGILLMLLFLLPGTEAYRGLGISGIQSTFTEPVEIYDWLGKLWFTALTLGSGFKGGEVTPLFFTGACLGNTLSHLIPLPMALMAAMGFVAVFSGATNTPLACTLMGIEIFGVETALFMGAACMMAYIFSGHTGIYKTQSLHTPKSPLFFGKKTREEHRGK